MGIEADIAAFESRLSTAIDGALKTTCLEAIKEALKESVYENVYRVYDPTVYVRAGEYGGLADTEEMDSIINDGGHEIVVMDVRADDKTGRLVAPIVENGHGYEYAPKKGIPPRPFHRKAQEDVIQSGAFGDALCGYLQASDFNAYSV